MSRNHDGEERGEGGVEPVVFLKYPNGTRDEAELRTIDRPYGMGSWMGLLEAYKILSGIAPTQSVSLSVRPEKIEIKVCQFQYSQQIRLLCSLGVSCVFVAKHLCPLLRSQV